MEEMNRFKIAKRITPFINTFFTEKWDVEKLIKILCWDARRYLHGFYFVVAGPFRPATIKPRKSWQTYYGGNSVHCELAQVPTAVMVPMVTARMTPSNTVYSMKAAPFSSVWRARAIERNFFIWSSPMVTLLTLKPGTGSTTAWQKLKPIFNTIVPSFFMQS